MKIIASKERFYGTLILQKLFIKIYKLIVIFNVLFVKLIYNMEQQNEIKLNDIKIICRNFNNFVYCSIVSFTCHLFLFISRKY